MSFTPVTVLRRSWPLALAFIVALAARLWALSAHSLLLDEAFVAVGARDILRNHTPIWDAISNAPFIWGIGHLIGLSGLNDPALVRLPAAVVGACSVLVVYRFARRLMGTPSATLAAFLYAVHPFAVAFSRILFADSFQVFFELAGCLAIDRYILSTRRYRPGLIAIVLLWAAAFLTKYNAIVPGGLWLLMGIVSRRYRLGPALVCGVLMLAASAGTLLLWPCDAPVWLAAFLQKGGSYDILNAAAFFWTKVHLVLFGITEAALAGGVVAMVLLNGERKKEIAHLVLFLVFYLVAIIFLGRTFERYLLITVPFACLLLAKLWEVIPIVKRERIRLWEMAGTVLLGLTTIVFAIGIVRSWTNYIRYLENDVDRPALTADVLRLEGEGHRAFWLVPEPIEAYYLGLSQHYSRATRPHLDGWLGEQNYFEWSALPYSEEWRGYNVLSVRSMLRRWGIKKTLFSPVAFIDSVHAIERGSVNGFKVPVQDYLTSDFVRPGDALVMRCGMTNLEGEPILEDVSHENGPPLLPSLPLKEYSVFRVYRPAGVSSNADTTITTFEAGMWVLVRK